MFFVAVLLWACSENFVS